MNISIEEACYWFEWFQHVTPGAETQMLEISPNVFLHINLN